MVGVETILAKANDAKRAVLNCHYRGNCVFIFCKEGALFNLYFWGCIQRDAVILLDEDKKNMGKF